MIQKDSISTGNNPETIVPNVESEKWYVAGAENYKDPLRRRDSPLQNLFPEKDGFIETGGPVHRRDIDWHLEPPSSSDGNNDDPLRLRDSPLHSLPDDGILESGTPEPRVKDSYAWFVNFANASPSDHY